MARPMRKYGNSGNKKKATASKVAKNVRISSKEKAKLKKMKGSSNTGKYKDVEAKDFVGAAGGASKYSYPIDTISRARAALAQARKAPNPAGIRRAVYKRYPTLKKNNNKQAKKSVRISVKKRKKK